MITKMYLIKGEVQNKNPNKNVVDPSQNMQIVWSNAYQIRKLIKPKPTALPTNLPPKSRSNLSPKYSQSSGNPKSTNPNSTNLKTSPKQLYKAPTNSPPSDLPGTQTISMNQSQKTRPTITNVHKLPQKISSLPKSSWAQIETFKNNNNSCQCQSNLDSQWVPTRTIIKKLNPKLDSEMIPLQPQTQALNSPKPHMIAEN